MRVLNKQNGETIIEVLISIAVLGLILAGTYALANRSTQANRQSQERAEALSETSSRVEQLKTYIENEKEVPNNTFCVYEDDSNTVRAANIEGTVPDNAQEDQLLDAIYPDECQEGPDGRYKTSISKSDGTYIVTTRWHQIADDTVEELSLYYEIERAGSLGGGSADPDSDVVPPPECNNGRDDDGDGQTDYPADDGCDGPQDNDETDPLPPSDPDPAPEPDPGPEPEPEPDDPRCRFKLIC